MVEIVQSIRKYNYWDGNMVDQGYARTSYTQRVGQYSMIQDAEVDIVALKAERKLYLGIF